MDIKEKIAKVKHKASRLAIKVATVATVATGTGAALTSCQENNNGTDKNEEKIENVGGAKTSVVYRTKQYNYKFGSGSIILMENGDVLDQSISMSLDATDKGAFLEAGDTVTYKGNSVKAVRYKDGDGKQVNFGKIGKVEKDR